MSPRSDRPAPEGASLTPDAQGASRAADVKGASRAPHAEGVGAGIDSGDAPHASSPVRPRLGFVGFMRYLWRQLTSMSTALVLLLLLAIAAVPGSLVPQRNADPNGVNQYFADHPQLAPALDAVSLFDVYTSPWFSAIYLLLFVSLIGCIIPRIAHHARALRARPPRTPVNLRRLGAYASATLPAPAADGDPRDSEAVLAAAERQLRRSGYRVTRYEDAKRGPSVSAERGYARESGNILFHVAMVGLLVTAGFGQGFTWTGQRVLVEGQTFVNSLVSYSSFKPGTWFSESSMQPYSLRLDSLSVDYDANAGGMPVDYTAHTTINPLDGQPAEEREIKVNTPYSGEGTTVYLLANGYAPTITVRDPEGRTVFTDSIPFLPQDANLTSIGVVKVPDGLARQVGMIGFFYPTKHQLESGAYASSRGSLDDPMLSLNVYSGDLGINAGAPVSVYSLNTDGMEQLAGGHSEAKPVQLRIGESAALPNGLGTVSLDAVPRFASFDIHHDPTQLPALISAALMIAGLLASLFISRRRLWVRVRDEGDHCVIEYAGLARGDDPRLESVVAQLATEHLRTLTSKARTRGADAGPSRKPHHGS